MRLVKLGELRSSYFGEKMTADQLHIDIQGTLKLNLTKIWRIEIYDTLR